MQPYQKFIIPIIFTVVTLFNTAHAKDGVYLSSFAGTTISSKSSTSAKDKDLKIGSQYGIGIGYNYQNSSYEISHTNISSKFKESDYRANHSITLFNLIHNFPVPSETLRPYVGIGLGFANSNIETNGISYLIKSAASYQVRAGTKLDIHQHIALFGDIRYTGLARSSFKNTSYNDTKHKIDFTYFTINIGASYLF